MSLTMEQLREAHAYCRLAELKDAWLERPTNYQPPPWAPREAHEEHRARWLRSAEYAHGRQILRDAGWRGEPEPEPTTP